MIRQYWKARGPLVLLYLVCAIGFGMVQLLSGQSKSLMGYTLLLMTAGFLLFAGIDGWHMYRRHKELKTVRQKLTKFEQALPPAQGLIEEDFREIGQDLREMYHTSMEEWERSSRAMLDYYTMWVHQIKTPIFALRLLLQEPELQREEMERELFQIERYVEMALTYVKTQNLSQDLVPAPCQVDDVIRSCVKKYAMLFIGKRLRVDVQPTGILAVTDPKWLAFVIEQGLSNAIKYTNTGGVTIRSEGENTLLIQDTGIGIRPEDVERVFEKGYTGYNGRMDKRASGIGLYLAKRIADQLQIGIHIQSTVGQGTTLRLQLPLPQEMFAE